MLDEPFPPYLDMVRSGSHNPSQHPWHIAHNVQYHKYIMGVVMVI